jgi:hypothetical protein
MEESEEEEAATEIADEDVEEPEREDAEAREGAPVSR